LQRPFPSHPATGWLGKLGKLDKGVQPITIRYYITPSERSEIEQAVMAESGSEPIEGQMAVAQCILTAAEQDSIRPTEVLVKYQYTPVRKDPTVSVRDAVMAVFDRGEVITSEPIIFFYAPARVQSKWHESQQHVMTIANHKFFKTKEN
jgi:spore germination cell wall hydrolase CwlJ-like protein